MTAALAASDHHAISTGGFSDLLRVPRPSRAEELARLVQAAQARQRDACAQILDVRKKRWEASASGVAAKVVSPKRARLGR